MPIKQLSPHQAKQCTAIPKETVSPRLQNWRDKRYGKRGGDAQRCQFNGIYEIDGKAFCNRHAAPLVLKLYLTGDLIDWDKKEKEALKAAIKPFSDAVYNDNGDVTVRHCKIEDYFRAYCTFKEIFGWEK